MPHRPNVAQQQSGRPNEHRETHVDPSSCCSTDCLASVRRSRTTAHVCFDCGRRHQPVFPHVLKGRTNVADLRGISRNPLSTWAKLPPARSHGSPSLHTAGFTSTECTNGGYLPRISGTPT